MVIGGRSHRCERSDDRSGHLRRNHDELMVEVPRPRKGEECFFDPLKGSKGRLAEEDKYAPIPCPSIVKGVLGLDARFWLLADILPHPDLRLLCPRKRTSGQIRKM